MLRKLVSHWGEAFIPSPPVLEALRCVRTRRASSPSLVGVSGARKHVLLVVPTLLWCYLAQRNLEIISATSRCGLRSSPSNRLRFVVDRWLACCRARQGLPPPQVKGAQQQVLMDGK